METAKVEGFVVALYNYTARKETELSYRKADVLALLRPPDSSGWWYGRHATADGAAASTGGGIVEGLFAHNYVKAIELQPYVGKHAFRGKGDDDAYLPFAQGDALEVVLPDSSGWWLARKAGGGRLGLVPSNYIAVAPKEEEPRPVLQPEQQPRDDATSTDASSSNNNSTGSTDTEEDRTKETSSPRQLLQQQQQPEASVIHATPAEEEKEKPTEVEAKAALSDAALVPTRLEEVLPPSALLDAALAQLLPSLHSLGGDTKPDSMEGTVEAGAQEGEGASDLIPFLRDQLQRREQFATQLADMLQGGDHNTAAAVLAHSG
jgi:hypothetical protein